jgi:predicted PurR-regulated permease PerM
MIAGNMFLAFFLGLAGSPFWPIVISVIGCTIFWPITDIENKE